jgi:hypothetical protein
MLLMRGGAMENQAFSPEQIRQAIQKYEDWARWLIQQGQVRQLFRVLEAFLACRDVQGFRLPLECVHEALEILGKIRYGAADW